MENEKSFLEEVMIWNELLQIIVGCILVYIAINDFKTHKITNWALLTLLAVGLGATWQQPLTIFDRIIGTLLNGTPLLIISMIKPKAFGGGDIKLAAIAGAMLGGGEGLVAQGTAFITGGIYSAVTLITGRAKRNDKFPFGPFICIGIAYCIYFVNS